MNIINTSSIDIQNTNNRVIPDPNLHMKSKILLYACLGNTRMIQWPRKRNRPKQVSIYSPEHHRAVVFPFKTL